MIGRLIGSRSFWLVFIGGLAIRFYLTVAVFGVQTLFTNNEANDDFAASEQRGAPISYGSHRDGFTP